MVPPPQVYYTGWFFTVPAHTGLAQVAGALANGPREAMGEEVSLVKPMRRKSAADFGSFLGEKSVPAKKVCERPTCSPETERERQCGTGTSLVEFEDWEMRTDDGSFLDRIGPSKSAAGGKVSSRPGSAFQAGLTGQSSTSRSSESALGLSLNCSPQRKRSPSKSFQATPLSQMHSSQGEKSLQLDESFLDRVGTSKSVTGGKGSSRSGFALQLALGSSHVDTSINCSPPSQRKRSPSISFQTTPHSQMYGSQGEKSPQLVDGSFLDPVGTTKSVTGGKVSRQSGSALQPRPPKQSSSSGSSETVLGSSQSAKHGNTPEYDHTSQTNARFNFNPLSPSQSSSQTVSRSKVKSTSSRQDSQMNTSQGGESKRKSSKSGDRKRTSTSSKSAEVRNPSEYDLASQIFTQSSSLVSSSQNSATQKSINSQLSQLSGFRIPHRRSNGDANLPRAELTRAAGHIMGSVARSIMEGSAGMVQNYLDGFGYGHDEGTS